MWYAHLGKPQQYPLKLSMCIVCALAVSLPGIYLTVSYVHKRHAQEFSQHYS